ncbi:GNAT family N-acetyltransferase [Sediminibacillus albus]|uniref:Acetyltransferase (GNAT) family protein n=1 Tax=Sediminibacillus albus TaxID=407036 RepID=A0A1G8WDS5_9BACI|nr:GNAT family N-acetyltransferase [Sediminibacillus albus]SDJ76414.1 Acetyltransferase (GNAT) family protein [Sediminibacillus albus]
MNLPWSTLPVIIEPMKEKDAMEISTWKYEEPYDLYSNDGSNSLLQELLDGSYYSASIQHSLIGYFCFGKSAQVPAGAEAGFYQEEALDIGLGLRPNLTGKGFGASFLKKGIDFAVDTRLPQKIRLTVAAFNQRAITVYQRHGFESTSAFMSNNIEFIIMTRQV